MTAEQIRIGQVLPLEMLPNDKILHSIMNLGRTLHFAIQRALVIQEIANCCAIYRVAPVPLPCYVDVLQLAS